MSAEYSAWLRENLTMAAFVIVAVIGAMAVAIWAVESFGRWLLARSERRRASHGEARR